MCPSPDLRTCLPTPPLISMSLAAGERLPTAADILAYAPPGSGLVPGDVEVSELSINYGKKVRHGATIETLQSSSYDNVGRCLCHDECAVFTGSRL